MLPLLALLTIVGFAYGADQKCMHCIDVKDISECSNTLITCGTGEKCYLEMVTTDTLEVRYNSGCRSSIVCSLMAGLHSGGGKKRLVNCAECCDDKTPGEVCNRNLCGVAANLTQDFSCVACDELVQDHYSCDKRKVCQQTEVCSARIFVQGDQMKYKFDCMSRHQCEVFANNGQNAGRRSSEGVEICSSCCYGHECNAADCFALFNNMSLPGFSLGTNPTGGPNGR